MRLCNIFYFDSAHYLPDYCGKCENPHGHTYKLEIVIEDKVKKDGMVLDFTILKDIVNREVVDVLDHRNLNEIVDNPTAEHIVEWIWKALAKKLPLHSVKLWEGEGKWAQKVR
ncbi:MAG: 6-carboxytetrahydropterin synthase QueD [Candidatus Altiarchaeota archaeon]